jgi:diguanylate cyclase (GGDEF)-like protein/PAS domain S-box-containing protein
MKEQDINDERLALALEAAGLDLWENNLVTGEIPRKAMKTFAELGYNEAEAACYVDEIFAIIHPDDVPLVKVAINNHLSNVAAQYRCEFRLRAKNGAWVWYANYGRVMDRDGVNAGQRFIGVTLNIDDRKRKEIEAELLNRALMLLSKSGSGQIRAQSEQELFAEICQLAVEIGGYLMAWVAFAENDAEKTVRPVAQSGYADGYLENANITWADSERGQGPTGTAIRTGATVVLQDIQADPKMAPWREAAILRGFQSSLALPLIVNERVIGALTIYSIKAYAFSAEEVQLLEELARDLSYGIQTLRSRKAYETTLLRSKQVIDTATDGFWLADMQGNLLDVNEAYAKMTGYSVDELLNMHISQLDAHDKPEDVKARIAEIIVLGSLSFETQHRHQDGHLIEIDVSATFLREENELVVFCRDITGRKRAEENLRESKEKYLSVFQNSPAGIFLATLAGRFLAVNPAFASMLNYASPEELIEQITDINTQVYCDPDKRVEIIAAMMQTDGWCLIEGDFFRKDGSVINVSIKGRKVLNADGTLAYFEGFIEDVTDRKRHESDLRRIAHFDALTGIPNRVLLADRMKQAIAQTSREQNMMAVCYLDLDGFKPINDDLGHAAGDRVLIEVAKRIGNAIRGGDTVARLGGDEFVVLLLGQNKGSECVATLKRLLATIAEPITVKDKSVSVSASIGVSIFPLDDEDPDTLLRHADQAMYVSKQTGKNRFYIYDLELDKRARDQSAFMTSFRHALDSDQFELYYQPKINLISRELVGAEALIRWKHPELGLLLPAEFIRQIENTELDIELGEWVTAAALEQMHQWRNLGLDIEVSINISGYHMESTGFVEKLQQQLAAYPATPQGKLQIEVLETVALNDIGVVREIIVSCRALGIGFALDDFGTGYSSLSYLSSLPVDTLKIDQSFVRDMLVDKGDLAIVQGIIALARAFERRTVAEGIETEEQNRTLIEMGCEFGQGYGIARPMRAAELINWHASHASTNNLKGGI